MKFIEVDLLWSLYRHQCPCTDPYCVIFFSNKFKLNNLYTFKVLLIEAIKNSRTIHLILMKNVKNICKKKLIS